MTADHIEARGRSGWTGLSDGQARVPETGAVELRGLPGGARVRLGPVNARADANGRVQVRLVDEDDLRCHIGLLPITVEDRLVGEVEVQVDKITTEAFAALRADLDETWLGLIREDDAPTALKAAPPDVRPLWRRLVPALEAIESRPRTELELVAGHARYERLRRPGQMTPAAVAAGGRGPIVPTEVLAERPVEADHAIVADTLRRIGTLARHQADAGGVAQDCRRHLKHPLFAGRGPFRTVSHGARHDPRYRRVLAVRTTLERADTIITEGPSDLRAGVKSIDRLYEYWVYLKVVEALAGRAGGLDEATIKGIATRLPGRRVRLELPRGTVVALEDGTEIAFEPTISTNTVRSWRALELDPHPEPSLAQQTIRPDVVIRLPEAPPNVVVIDAKYRGRHRIDAATVDVHARYGRLRFRGTRAVREVVVAHPHADLTVSYPGYRAVPFSPGRPIELPRSTEQTVVKPPAITEREIDDPEALDTDETPLGAGPSPVTIIADQWWMHQTLGSQRIDLRDLANQALAGRQARRLVIQLPPLVALKGFAAAATRCGWEVQEVSDRRPAQIRSLLDAVREAEGTIVVLTGDDGLRAALRQEGLSAERFDELDTVSDLR